MSGGALLDWLDDLPELAEQPVLGEDLRAPVPYFGGKRDAAAVIWERLGDVVNYVEPFAGSLAVLLARPAWHRARVETANDLDALVVNFWRATAGDPDAVARLVDWPVFEVDLHARHRWLIGRRATLAEELEADPRAYDLEAAAWWAWGASCWLGGGWCADSLVRNRKRPALGGDGGPRPGAGVHAQGLRGANAEGRPRPALSGGSGRRASAKAGTGVHASALRVSRALPDLGGSSRGDERWPNTGKGVNAAHMRTALHDTFTRLWARLRHVRFACGDWTRVVTPAVTWRHGLTGVVLDPPYGAAAARTMGIYAKDSLDVSSEVRAWAREAGARTDMRVVVCGYEGEHDDLEREGWTVVAWKARGGYGNQADGRGRANAARERLWFSPHCSRLAQQSLFGSG